MPPHKSYYDGKFPVIHTVKRGESLSAIATHYKFKSWQPIWIFNTQKEHMLDPKGDPGSLEVGQRLFIPRSKEGYDKLLKKLEALKGGLEGSGEGQMYELDGLNDQYNAEKVAFDFAGDVATLLGSLSARALEVARLRRGAEGLKGAQRFAHEIKLRKSVEDLAEAVRVKKLKEAARDGVVEWGTGQMPNEKAGEYAKTSWTFGTKTVKKIGTLRSDQKIGRELRRAVGISSLLDVADAVLDYVKVSNVANGILWLWKGETVDGALNSARDNVRANITRGLANLHEKILRIQKERDLLYHPGSGAIESPAVKRT